MNPDEAVLLWVDEYTRMADAYEANVAPRFAPFSEALVARAGLAAHATVLDVSTGTGLTALLAAKAVGPSGLVVGIDLADGALAVAQTKAARAGLRNVRLEMMDSRNIVYRGGAFDAALCSFGIPAVGHAQVFREVQRVLRDGATFHALGWGPRRPEAGWDAFDEALAAHRTASPSEALARLREAGDLVAQSGDAAATRDARAITAKMRDAGFSDVDAEPRETVVAFGTLDDLIAHQASFGTTERELGEMGESARTAFRRDLEAGLAAYREGEGVRLRWSTVLYAAKK